MNWHREVSTAGQAYSRLCVRMSYFLWLLSALWSESDLGISISSLRRWTLAFHSLVLWLPWTFCSLLPANMSIRVTWASGYRFRYQDRVSPVQSLFEFLESKPSYSIYRFLNSSCKAKTGIWSAGWHHFPLSFGFEASPSSEPRWGVRSLHTVGRLVTAQRCPAEMRKAEIQSLLAMLCLMG